MSVPDIAENARRQIAVPVPSSARDVSTGRRGLRSTRVGRYRTAYATTVPDMVRTWEVADKKGGDG
eukprot:1937306-Rhodomonas_salina.1